MCPMPNWSDSTRKPSAWPTVFACTRRIRKYLHGLTEAARRAAQKGAMGVGRPRRAAPVRRDARRIPPPSGCAARMAGRADVAASKAGHSTKPSARCEEVDRIRELFTRYFFGPTATQPAQYDLVVNTARVPLEDVTGMVVTTVRSGSAPAVAARPLVGRVLTLSRELGAGDTGLHRRWPIGSNCTSTTANCWSRKPLAWASRGRTGEDRRTAGQHLPAVPAR